MNLRGCLACNAHCSSGCVGDSGNQCECLVCFGVAVLGFSISTFICIY